jgi:hypothetical protein
MRQLLLDIDRLLRGRYTKPEDLRAGKISLPARALIFGSLILGSSYGLFMGIYGATRPDDPTVMQLFATTAKVPLLFLLTLVVTFPSLYVLSALAGSRLKFQETLRLLLAAIAINLALLASLGPVVGFFTLSTQSYPFMIVLNVLFFGVSGIVGLAFLRRALRYVFAPKLPTEIEPVEAATQLANLPSHRRSDMGLIVFRGWLVVYGVVGAQMGWVLRPFVGSPDLPFTLFRERESNFLEGFFNALLRLFS